MAIDEGICLIAVLENCILMTWGWINSQAHGENKYFAALSLGFE